MRLGIINMINLLAKKILVSSLLLLTALQISAHEVWLEQDKSGSVRVYLGEPGVPDTGDKIDKLAGSHVFTSDTNDIALLNQLNDHWQANVNDDGDVRLFTESVWQPWAINENPWWKFWASDEEHFQGAILQARAGRNETTAKLNFELVPVTKNGNVFTAIFEEKTLANQPVELLSPSKKTIELHTDENGELTVTSEEKGRFILSSVHTVDKEATHSGKQVKSLMYITSLSFVAL